MRVAFFGQTGPYAPDVLRHLVTRARGYDVVLVVEGRPRAGAGRPHRLLEPRPAPLPPGDRIADIGRAAGVPVLETRDVNDRHAVGVLRDHRLEAMVCVGFDRLFAPAVLATASRVRLNVHPSPLPELRGPSPIFWALRHGMTELAVTVHGLDAREDHGPIHAQERFVLPRAATGAEIFRLAARVAAPMLHDLLVAAGSGPLTGAPQEHARATRAPRPRPEDARVVPAEWSCHHLVRFACGAPFFRAPWMRLGDSTFHVRSGIAAQRGRRLPAEYVVQGSTLVVQCADGVAVLEVQV